MKYLSFVFVSFLIVLQTTGQNELHLGFSQTFSSFNFKSSTAEKDDFVSSDVNSGSAIGYNISLPKWMDLRFDLSLLNMGARAAYEAQSVKWDLNYINANVNFGFRYKKSTVQPYLLLGPYMSYLYKGSQEIGSSYYNLIELKKIKRMDLGVNALYGANFVVSPSFKLFIEGRHTIGLNQIEKDANSQKLYNRAFSIVLGIKVILEKESGNE